MGGNLDIISTPGTGSQSNSSASLGFSFTGPTIGRSGGDPLLTADNADKALGGLSLGGIQPGFGSGSGSTNWIDTPAGLYSTGQQTITVGGNTNLAASGLISDTGQVDLTTGTFTWSDFSGSQEYRDIEVDANIDLYNDTDANGKNINNSSAQGKYQLDNVQQTVKATVTGDITITDPTKQAALEQSGATKPAHQANKDPSQQSVITKNEHIDLEPYVSVQSLRAAVAAGKTITQIIESVFEKMFADGHFSGPDHTALNELAQYWNNADVKRQLAACAACAHAENESHFLDWLITPAYAGDSGCPFRLHNTLFVITPAAAQTCLETIEDIEQKAGDDNAVFQELLEEEQLDRQIVQISPGIVIGGYSNVWSTNPIARCIAIESNLAQTEYSESNGWFHIGAEKNGYFPWLIFSRKTLSSA